MVQIAFTFMKKKIILKRRKERKEKKKLSIALNTLESMTTTKSFTSLKDIKLCYNSN